MIPYNTIYIGVKQLLTNTVGVNAMKKAIMILCCFIITFILFTIFIKPNTNENSGNASDYVKNEYKSNTVYVVKEYKGNIAIFEENKDTPFKITDISIRDLPDGDKKLLIGGIHASTFQELNCILEDYCS